jgi:hypothetical protein
MPPSSGSRNKPSKIGVKQEANRDVLVAYARRWSSPQPPLVEPNIFQNKNQEFNALNRGFR